MSGRDNRPCAHNEFALIVCTMPAAPPPLGNNSHKPQALRRQQAATAAFASKGNCHSTTSALVLRIWVLLARNGDTKHIAAAWLLMLQCPISYTVQPFLLGHVTDAVSAAIRPVLQIRKIMLVATNHHLQLFLFFASFGQTNQKTNAVSSIKHCLTKAVQTIRRDAVPDDANIEQTCSIPLCFKAHTCFGGQMHTLYLQVRIFIQYPIGSASKPDMLVSPPTTNQLKNFIRSYQVPKMN